MWWNRLGGGRLVVLLLAGALICGACSGQDPATADATESLDRIAALERELEESYGSDEATALLDRIAALERELEESHRFRESIDELAASFYPSEEAVVTVFLDDDAALDKARLDAVVTALSEIGGVAGYVYVSKDEAYEEASVLFGDDPRMIETLEANPTLLPASLRFTMEGFSDGLVLRSIAQRTDGVNKAMLGYPGVTGE